MIRRISIALLLCIGLLGSNALTAQNESQKEKKDLTNGTIAEQFDYVIDNSNRYQSFKVVKKTWMATLKNHVKDTLKSFHQEIAGLRTEIKTKSDKISSLEANLGNVQTDLTTVTGEKDNINFMGMALTKAKYKSMMWGIVAGLGALFLFFLLKFKSSNSITKSTKNDLNELQTEFADYKKKSLSKEQELARKLQDELNKFN